MSELRRAIVSGVGWQSAAALASQGIAVAFAVLLARLLEPADFGLVAMVSVVTGFAALLAQLGLGAALVQADSLDEERLASSFWLNLASGLALAAVVAAAAPLLAAFYGEPRLVPLTRVLALEFPLAALAAVPVALARRELRFRRIAAVETTAALAGGVVATLLALSGLGVWSLVVRALVGSGLRTLCFAVLARFVPRARFRFASVRELVPFGSAVFGSQTLRYWTRNLDSLLIGRFVGVEALGLYNAAYRLLLLPLSHGAEAVRRVLFPALAKIRGERERTRSIFLRAAGALALLAFPVQLGLLAVVDVAVPVVLGERWTPMVPVARVFCALGVVQSLGGLLGALYLSQGRADLQLRWGLLFRATSILGIVVGLRFGPLGVAVGYSLASLLNVTLNTRVAGALVDVTLRDVAGRLCPVLACAALMSAGVLAVGEALAGRIPAAAALGVRVAAGAALYAALVLATRPRAFREVAALLRELRQSPAPRGELRPGVLR
jgi:PST family polysaccharide transporter